MALRPGKFVRNAGASAQDARFASVGDYARNADGSVRSGVLGTAAALVSGRTDRTLNVAAFSAVAWRAGQGVYAFYNDGAMQSPAVAASPASNSRIDVLYVQHQDGGTGGAGDASSVPVLGIQQGTAAAQPTVPSIASIPGAVELARIQVPAGAATSNAMTITQSYPRTAAAGGSVLVRDRAELDAWVAADGQKAVTQHNGIEWVRVGGSWKTVTPWGVFSFGSTSTTGVHTITHDLGVVPTWAQVSWDHQAYSSDGQAKRFRPIIWNRSASQIQVRLMDEQTNDWVNTAQFIRVSVTAGV